MKKRIEAARRATHVISVLIIICLCKIAIGQDADNNVISDQEYEVINSIFGSKQNGKVTHLYCWTLMDYNYSHYFNKSNLDAIYDRVGLGTTISDEKLEEMLTEEVLSNIRRQIGLHHPIKLDKSKLSKQIKLHKAFKKPSDFAKIKSIGRPIIVGDLAVMKYESLDISSISILQKKGNQWKVIYRFEEWLSLQD